MTLLTAKWRAILFFALSLLSLGLAAYFLSVCWESIESRGWPHVQGSIVKNYMTRTCGASQTGKSWEARVTYQYIVDGSLHRAERVGNSAILCDDNRSEVQGWLDIHYPIGKAVEVYYSRADANAAFLQPGDVTAIDVIMISAAFVLSALMAISGWKTLAASSLRDG